jgi:hypothetical protein
MHRSRERSSCGVRSHEMQRGPGLASRRSSVGAGVFPSPSRILAVFVLLVAACSGAGDRKGSGPVAASTAVGSTFAPTSTPLHVGVTPSTTAPTVLSTSTSVAVTTTQTPSTTPASSAVSLVRLGCSIYCRNAGEYGDGSEDPPALRINTNGPVRVLPDGTVPISVTCLVATTCRGALSLGFVGQNLPWNASSDLVVDGNQTTVFGLTLSAADLDLIRTSGPIEASIFADGFLTAQCSYKLPPGEACTRFFPAPGVDPTTGMVARTGPSIDDDGRDYLAGTDVLLSA